MTDTTEKAMKEGRVARRQRRNREALIRAASAVMSEKGIDAATMLEIADRADVGAGTVYNYFKSKDDLAIAVLEEIMQGLALRVESATAGLDDPAHIYAIAPDDRSGNGHPGRALAPALEPLGHRRGCDVSPDRPLHHRPAGPRPRPPGG